MAVETPVVSSVGASSLRSAPTMLALVTVRMASSSCKAHAAGLRGAGAGEAGGVQAVEVDGQVNGHLAGTELLSELGKAREIELVHLSVGSRKLKLAAVTAADAELVDAPVTDEVMATAQDTGVAELCAQIVVPQVGMGIKVDDVEVGGTFPPWPARHPA